MFEALTSYLNKYYGFDTDSRVWKNMGGGGKRILNESFNDDLLEYPQYTKPKIWVDIKNKKEHKVPEILLSGNHKKIDEWRKKQSIIKTKKYRPKLIKGI